MIFVDYKYSSLYIIIFIYFFILYILIFCFICIFISAMDSCVLYLFEICKQKNANWMRKA